jgi:hypothetical protein
MAAAVDVKEDAASLTVDALSRAPAVGRCATGRAIGQAERAAAQVSMLPEYTSPWPC